MGWVSFCILTIMALTVETGSGSLTANSFVTLAEARAYALDRGVTLSADDATLTVTLIKAADWIFSKEQKFKGLRTHTGQRMPFPRVWVYLFNVVLGSEEIPELIKEAQIKLAMASEAGTDLRPNGDGRTTVRERVGPIETEYLKQDTSNTQPVLNEVEDLLQPLMEGGGSAFHQVERA